MKKKLLISLLVPLFASSFCNGQQAVRDTSLWTLDRCIEVAIANNITIRGAVLEQQSAEARLQQAKAARYPSLNATASHDLNSNIAGNSSSTISNSTNAGLNAQMVLYQGSRVNQEVQQNKLLVQQQLLWIEEAKNSVSLGVAQFYIQALFYKEGIRIAMNNLSTSQKQLEQTQARFAVGSVSSRELAEVQSQNASGQYDLIAVENSYYQQLLDIKQLLELDPAKDFEIETPVSFPDSGLTVPGIPQIYSAALAILPEVQSDNLQLGISELDVKMAKSGYIPSLSLGAGLSTGYYYANQSDIGDNLNGSLGLTLSIPILDNRQTKTAIQTARISEQKSLLQQQTTAKELYRKIEVAWRDFMATKSQITAARAARDAAETSYNLARQQYELGGLSATDLLTSQNTYMNAEQNLLQVKYNNLMNYLLLQYYQGKPLKISL